MSTAPTLGSLETSYKGPTTLRAANGKPFYGDRYMVKEMGFEKPLHYIYNAGISRNWNTFHENITKGNFARQPWRRAFKATISRCWPERRVMPMANPSIGMKSSHPRK